MRRVKFCGLGILAGIIVGIGAGQLVLALMKGTGGILLARDIFGAVYGTPVLFAWLGYLVGAWLSENWNR